MIEVSSGDLRPLEDFKMRDRWSAAQGSGLPSLVLSQIHPLTKERAEGLEGYSYAYFQELSRFLFPASSEPLKSALFHGVECINIGGEPRGRVEAYLRKFQPEGDQQVIVSWFEGTAVLVMWDIVCTYWDEFCEVQDEAVTILPLSEAWALLYYHEEYIVLGHQRFPLLDEEARERIWNPPTKPFLHHEELLRLLDANQKIEAIKLYSRETGVKLKKAKEVIDLLVAERNSLDGLQ